MTNQEKEAACSKLASILNVPYAGSITKDQIGDLLRQAYKLRVDLERTIEDAETAFDPEGRWNPPA
jgi:hypothetical protein